jgi:hypothetical protein
MVAKHMRMHNDGGSLMPSLEQLIVVEISEYKRTIHQSFGHKIAST